MFRWNPLYIYLHSALAYGTQTKFQENFQTLGIMVRIKRELSLNALCNIYNTLMLPHLNDGLTVWGWKAKRLITLRKRAVRIMTKSHFRAHTTNLFQKLNARLYILVKFDHSMLPHYFMTEMKSHFQQNIHRYLTRKKHCLKLPTIKLEFTKHCILYKDIHLF